MSLPENYSLIYPFRKVWLYVLAALGVSLLFNFFLWPGVFDSMRGAIIGTLWSASHWVAQSMGNGYVGYRIAKKISWLEQPWKRALVEIIGLMTYSVTAFILVQSFFLFLWNGALPKDFLSFMLDNVKLAISISFSIAFILTTIGFFRNWRKSSLEAERLKTEMMTYRYESLRNQVNPHFLFNSLNVLSELVVEEPKKAVTFIRQLSDLYRYVLDSSEREVVPLSEELEFIKSFSYLLETRFEDKLEIVTNVPSQADERIVPMALQGLLENAVKHNEVSSKFPLKVEIARDGDRLTVRNLIRKKEVGEDSKLTGLKNLIARYEVLTDEEIRISEEEGVFTVSLPILREDIT